jgi:hypothetical protein
MPMQRRPKPDGAITRADDRAARRAQWSEASLNARARLKLDRRRALELLASCRDGCTEAVMLADGFSIDMMVEIINAGLATATTERMVAGKHRIEVARVRITDAGRQVLAKATA